MAASVRSGRRTGSPRDFKTLNACGEVTSWMRCKSIYSTAGVSKVSGTTSCAVQTLSNNVRAVMACEALAAARAAAAADLVGFAGFQPGHPRAQLRADFFDRMFEIGLQQLGIFAPPGSALRDPLAREFALLNLRQNLFHFLLDGIVDVARAASKVAVLRALADEAVHLGDAALMQEIDDQFQFMQTLVVRDRRLIAGLDQGFVALDDKLCGAAAQNRLLAEQI